MTTFRIKKKDNYSVIANAVINDASLSWGARGLLIYLLSKPDNWITRTSDLIKKSPAGERRVRTLIAELEKAGYMKRRRFHDDGGQWTWETDVHEKPTILTFSTDGLSTDGKPQDIVKTDLQSNEGGSNKKSKDKIKDIPANAGRAANPAPSPLLPTGRPSEYMFSVINRNRKLNGRNAMSKYANITQKENTEGALEKVSKAGELEKAVDWAMQNERTTRAAMCRAMISWAGNLGKQNGRGPTRNLSDEYRREADLAAAQRGIDEAKKYGKR